MENKKTSQFNNYTNLRKALINYDESNLSHGEMIVYKALKILSKDYAWRMYIALYDFVDSWLY